jgi:hypothetical protein
LSLFRGAEIACRLPYGADFRLNRADFAAKVLRARENLWVLTKDEILHFGSCWGLCQWEDALRGDSVFPFLPFSVSLLKIECKKRGFGGGGKEGYRFS